jgi:hypothetical protein
VNALGDAVSSSEAGDLSVVSLERCRCHGRLSTTTQKFTMFSSNPLLFTSKGESPLLTHQGQYNRQHDVQGSCWPSRRCFTVDLLGYVHWVLSGWFAAGIALAKHQPCSAGIQCLLCGALHPPNKLLTSIASNDLSDRHMPLRNAHYDVRPQQSLGYDTPLWPRLPLRAHSTNN